MQFSLLHGLAFVIFYPSGPIGLVQAALQAITPGGIRAQVPAVYLRVIPVVGLARGPSLLAAVTDCLFHEDAAVGASIAVLSATAAVTGLIVFGLGLNACMRKAAPGIHPRSPEGVDHPGITKLMIKA